MQDKNIIDELRRIEQEHGVLRPGDVVEAARPATSPLHSQFEWDDGVAAERYRNDQARSLIRVCVEYVGPTKRRQQVFVSLSTDRSAGGGYRSLVEVLAIDNLRNQLIEDALADMERFTGRYSHIAELARVTEAMRDTKRQIRGQSRSKKKAS